MSYSPELEVWRDRQRALLREVENSRLAREARKARGGEPSFEMGLLRGALSRIEVLARCIEKRPGC